MKASRNERYQTGDGTENKMLNTIDQSMLPRISMRGLSIQELSKTILGHRQDENCNLNRRALMIEKANRLGEQMTVK